MGLALAAACTSSLLRPCKQVWEGGWWVLGCVCGIEWGGVVCGGRPALLLAHALQADRCVNVC